MEPQCACGVILSDGDTSLLLLIMIYPIHGGPSLLDLVQFHGVVNDSLGSGNISGVDVVHDTCVN